MTMYGIKDCVEAYAKRRGIPKTQAESEFKDAMAVVSEMCVKGGVSIKGMFTIKKKVQKGRKGTFNGKEWQTEDKYTLGISTGKELEAELNK